MSKPDDTQPIPASHENGQAELVEAIIELNNMGDDWDAQHISELVADWHNKQIEELLDRLEAHWTPALVPDGEHPDGKSESEVVPLSAVKAERAKLKEVNDEPIRS